MDMRNGDIYPNREAAIAAGVPARELVEIEPEIVRVTSGPFRGRVYQRNPITRQLFRRKDLEHLARLEAAAGEPATTDNPNEEI